MLGDLGGLHCTVDFYGFLAPEDPALGYPDIWGRAHDIFASAGDWDDDQPFVVVFVARWLA